MESTSNDSPRLIALTYSLVVISLADNPVDECSSNGDCYLKVSTLFLEL